MTHEARDRWTYRAIATGVLIPLVYYGSQLLAMPFAQHYSFVRQVASELGMATVSSRPIVFNLAKIVGSLPLWIAAVGFAHGLRRLGARPIPSWLTAVALVAIALNEIQAGVFPLPDERHEGPFMLGYPLWSFSFLAAAARVPASGKLRIYVAVCIALAVLLMAARGVIGEPSVAPFAGLFQRVFAFVTVVPIGVAAWFLAARFEDQVPARRG